MANDTDFGGLDIELFGDLLADRPQRDTVMGADLLPIAQIMYNLNPWQLERERFTATGPGVDARGPRSSLPPREQPLRARLR